MANKLSITDLPVQGKKVLIRVDFNVPLDNQQKITDDTRIKASLASIQYVLKNKGSVILMSHLGRPKGEFKTEFSLKPCAARLSELLDHPVIMAPDCVGTEAQRLANSLKPGQVLLLENLRFHPAEEKPEKDPSFAKQLAALGELYVNDAFGTAHRAHASTAAITQYFPQRAAAGFLLRKEMDFIGGALINPKRPFVAIIGGAKISTKLGVLRALLNKADTVLLGGGMAYTFFKAQGIPIGNSIHEDEMLGEAKSLLDATKAQKNKLILPVDLVIAKTVNEASETQVVDASKGIPDGYEGVDVGPKTVRAFSGELKNAATVLWNGPLGIFEIPKFATGTRAVAETVAGLSATTIVGGGDSIAALQQMGLADSISHVSTGGGATLEYIEFGTLPGIDALSEKS